MRREPSPTLLDLLSLLKLLGLLNILQMLRRNNSLWRDLHITRFLR